MPDLLRYHGLEFMLNLNNTIKNLKLDTVVLILYVLYNFGSYIMVEVAYSYQIAIARVLPFQCKLPYYPWWGPWQGLNKPNKQYPINI